jgi:uncharacterized repeat protein (TIGR01451 family)
VRNLGPADYHGDIVIDDFAALLGPGGGALPGGAVEALTPGWVCVVEGAGTRCSYAESFDLIAGGAPIHFEVRVNVPATLSADLRNCGNLAWSEMAGVEDTNAANDRDCDTRPINQQDVVGPPVVDLQITKQAMQANCEPGGQCDFTIRITNNGPDTFTGQPLVVTDDLPPYHAVAVDSWWRCSEPALTISCRPSEGTVRITPGDFIELHLHGRLQASGLAQTVENCAAIDWARMAPLTGDSNAGNDRACASVPVTMLISNLAITTQALGVCRLGALCNIGVTVRNTSALPFHGQLGIDGRLSPALQISQLQALGAGWVCSTAGSGAYECRHNPLDLAPGAQQSFRVAVPIPASVSASSLRHSVRLFWVEGRPDANSKDDEAVVVIPLEQPVQPHICIGGRKWNGSTCVCPSGRVWNGQQCIRPSPSVTCAGGNVQDGSCICPSGWTRTQTATNAYRCSPPTAVLTCANGKVVNGACVCPSGWSRERTSSNAYRCVRPQVELRCINGKVRNGQCLCPSNWRRVPIGTNAYRCERPQATLQCIGGTVDNGRCNCPRGMKAVRVKVGVYRCVKQ